MSRPRRVLYAGTYERDYPRNRQFIRCLRASGTIVDECHAAVWETIPDKSRGLVSVSALMLLLLSLIRAYLRVLPGAVARFRRSDAVIIGYIGQLDVLMIGSLARLCRVPVIFNPLVTLTDTIVEDRQLAGPNSWLARIVWMIDFASLRIASHIVTDTDENATHICRIFRIPAGRVTSLPVGADETFFTPAPESQAGQAPFTVLFYGKMIPLHGIETILDAISVVANAPDSDIWFELVGSGQLEDRVSRFLQANPDFPVMYRPWVAYRRLPQRIAMADCVLGIFGTSAKAARVVPNKVFQAMAVGRPIITRDSPASRRVLAHESSAILIPPGDSQRLAEAILQLRDDACLRSRLALESRRSFEKCASDAVVARQLSELLDSVIGPSDGTAEMDAIS